MSCHNIQNLDCVYKRLANLKTAQNMKNRHLYNLKRYKIFKRRTSASSPTTRLEFDSTEISDNNYVNFIAMYVCITIYVDKNVIKG